jgi:dTDP-4-amino-4,6-dideoxygalactose transaminase
MKKFTIPFNKPYFTGKETEYIKKAVSSGKISGDGMFTARCQQFFEKKYHFRKALLTTSCTDALEMAALLLNIEEGDEIICPSFTFVSTANAFVLRGAKIVFADSMPDNPNIDLSKIEPLINKKTKAIIIVHYGGVACEMDILIKIAQKYGITIIEDCAHSIDSYYYQQPLGSFGTFSTFSFHETKNIISGEGGMIIINNEKYIKRAEIIREKGTNRSSFFRGEVNKYGWVDIGSSFLPSDIIAAFLYSQLKNLKKIQAKRILLWQTYYEKLKPLEQEACFKMPKLPEYATNNGHLFYILCRNTGERTALINYLKKNGILAVFHYLPLHKSPFYKRKHDGRILPNSELFSKHLLRLPLYYELSLEQVNKVTENIYRFYEKNKDGKKNIYRIK